MPVDAKNQSAKNKSDKNRVVTNRQTDERMDATESTPSPLKAAFHDTDIDTDTETPRRSAMPWNS